MDIPRWNHCNRRRELASLRKCFSSLIMVLPHELLLMILWRISTCSTLDGSGGVYVCGRRHSKGRPVVYCSMNPSTVLLETLVHLGVDEEDRLTTFRVLKIEAPDSLSRETLNPSALPRDWQNDLSVTQDIGDRWLSEARSCALTAPSVLYEDQSSVILNPLHIDAHLLQIVSAYKAFYRS